MTDDTDLNNIIQFRLKDRFKLAKYSETDPFNGDTAAYFKDLESDSSRLGEKLIDALNAFIIEERITLSHPSVAVAVGKFAASIASYDETHRECILAHLDILDEEPIEKQEEVAALSKLWERLGRGRNEKVRNLKTRIDSILGEKVCTCTYTIDDAHQIDVFVIKPAKGVEVLTASSEIIEIAKHLARRSA